MKECPSCGSAVDEKMAFCPVCGTTIHIINQTKNVNAALEDDLARAEAYATSVLYTKSKVVIEELNTGEINFLNIIDKYPSESKAYTAYVNYMTKYIERVMNPNQGDAVIFFKDINGLVEKCKTFLDNAAKYNIENDDEIIQEVSRLQGCLESLKMNQPEINAKNDKNKKRALLIIVGIVFIALCFIIAYIID